jgi:hypothetical protein
VLGASLRLLEAASEAIARPMPGAEVPLPEVRAPDRLARAGEPDPRPRQAALGGRSNLSALITNRMGIDIYAEWKGMSDAEKEAQITGFSVDHGHVGYLREAYHGEPYATHVLVAESFEDGRAAIPAATLRERLPETLEVAERRERELYGETDAEAISRVLKSFSDFVELCAQKEDETGEPCLIIASY